VLAALEEGREGHKPLARIDDLPLFATTPATKPAIEPSVVEEELRKISPDALTPKQALELLYELKGRLSS
jgi:DNA mismatch repair protein MutS